MGGRGLGASHMGTDRPVPVALRYLKAKALKKKVKHKAGAPTVEKELQLRDKVAFGEVVHAPLKVQVRRGTD